MANPPQPTPTRPETTTRPARSTGKSWGIYIAVAVVALLALFLLFGSFSGPDETVATDPMIEQVPVGAATQAPTAIAPGGTLPAGNADPVIVIEGDAEVEVIDDN